MIQVVASDEIGTRIRKRRQVLGMKQHELAAAVGVSSATVANWESGKHFPLRYQGRIEEVLGIDLDNRERLPAEVAANQDDPVVMQVWTALDLLTPEERLGFIRIHLDRRRRAGLASAPAPGA